MSNVKRRTIRVLAADDSAVMRRVLQTIFDLHGDGSASGLPPMDLCGVVRDGVDCLEAVTRLQPDVLLLDLEMPRMNGMEVLLRLRSLAPTLPVIMCSAYTVDGAKATLEALANGAKDYVMKPSQQSDFASALDLLMQQLLPRIAAFSAARDSQALTQPTVLPVPFPGDKAVARAATLLPSPALALRTPMDSTRVLFGPPPGRAKANVELVVIGVSTGGPSALEEMLPRLPAEFPVPILLVQHMPSLFTAALAERLDRCCSLRVALAVDGTPVEPGTIWLAPGDIHMEIAFASARHVEGVRRKVIRLHGGEPLNHCRPAVDHLFRSAAEVSGSGVLALVMTGMGADGLEGARAVCDAGGSVLAQDQASSAVWGMPGQVVRAGLASAILPLSRIAEELTQRAHLGRPRNQTTSPAAEGSSDAHNTRPAQHARREALHGLL